MGAEKIAAFSESWNAMAIQALRANHEVVASFWRFWWQFWSSGKLSPHLRSQFHDAAYGVLSRGIGPVHRRRGSQCQTVGANELPLAVRR
jgi:hypothetical protein